MQQPKLTLDFLQNRQALLGFIFALTRNQHAAERYHYVPDAPGSGKFLCPCFWDPKAIARFREQPKHCSCYMCGNPRRHAKGVEVLTLQERRAFQPDE